MTPQIFFLLVVLVIAGVAAFNFVDYFFDKRHKNKAVKK